MNVGLEEAWTSYRVFEEAATPSHDLDEQKMIASKQMQLVDDKHNLAKEVYRIQDDDKQQIKRKKYYLAVYY